MDETARTCHWCSSPIPIGATACPQCGAVVEGAAGEIPGLTEIDPSAPRGDLPEMVPNPIGWLRAGRAPAGANSAYKVPSEDVLREMRRMEREAESLDAGASRLDPFADPAIDADAPPDAEISAPDPGLVEAAGPAHERKVAEPGRAGSAKDPNWDSKGSSKLG